MRLLGTISRLSLPVLAGLYLVWCFLMYLGYHPEQWEYITQHPYANTIVFTLGIATVAAGGSYWRLRKKRKWVLPLRGVLLIALALIAAILAYISFRDVTGQKITATGPAIGYFSMYSLWYVFTMLLLALWAVASGDWLLQLGLKKKRSPIVALAVGISLIGFIATLLGLFGGLQWWLLWPLFLLAIIVRRQTVFSTVKDWLFTKHQWHIKHWWELSVAIIGLSCIGVYWVGGLKPFAVGFDGSALYANLAHLTANYGALPGSSQAYSWSVIMSLGEVMFNDVRVSLLLSHFMYVPALVLLYQLVRLWAKPAFALLAAVLVLSMQYTGFHALADEKVDLGLLVISLGAILLLLQWRISKQPTSGLAIRKPWTQASTYILLLVGWMLGFAFGVKYTSLFLLIGVLSAIAYHFGGFRLLWGSLLTLIALLFMTGFQRWGNLPLGVIKGLVTGLVLIIVAAGYVWYNSGKRKIAWRPFLQSAAVVLIGFALSFSPWTIKHLSENGFKPTPRNILFGKPDSPTLEIPDNFLSLHFNTSPFDQPYLVQLTADQEETTSRPQRNERGQEGGQGRREEIERYLGYEKGVSRYTSIPFDLANNINIPGIRHQEVGFFYLFLFPFLFLGFAGKRRQSGVRNTLVALGVILWLGSCFWTLTEADNLSNHLAGMRADNVDVMDGLASNTITPLWELAQQPFSYLGGLLAPLLKPIGNIHDLALVPVLLLLLFGCSLLWRKRFTGVPNTLKFVLSIVFGFGVLWFLLGNAIVWYGFPLFAIIAGLSVFWAENPREFLGPRLGKASLPILQSLFGLQLLLNFAMAYSSPLTNQEPKFIYNWPMIEQLARNDWDGDDVLRYFNPVIPDLYDVLNRNRSAKIYRVNTFTNYHILDSDSRIFEDNQLSQFANTSAQLSNPQDFIQVLKTNGFRYILYDLNSASLDRTPERSLTQKCNQFLQLLRTSTGVQLKLSDNYVSAPNGPAIRLPNGQTANARQGVFGSTVFQGSWALFEIL